MKSTVSYSARMAALSNWLLTAFMASGRRVRYSLGSTKSMSTHAHSSEGVCVCVCVCRGGGGVSCVRF
jgi:hypothetical protein